jgi:FkbM family methyltransferase
LDLAEAYSLNPYIGYHIKNLLRPIFGFSTPYRRDMRGVAAHFRDLGFNPATILDIGVATGTYQLYEVWPDAKLILVDPVSDFESAMKYICAHRRTPASYVVAAAGDRDGSITLRHTDYLSGASIMPGQSDQGTVPMYTIDTIDSMFSGSGPYLMKVDVQGAEMSVLSGATRVLPMCEVVMLEAPLFRFDGNNNTIVELIDFMREKGFVPSDIYDGLCRPLDGSLGQVDVAFVKAEGRFRQSHTWETKKQGEWRNRKSRIRRLMRI